MLPLPGLEDAADGHSHTDRKTVYDALEEGKERSNVDLDVLRDHLQEAGLLIDLGLRRYRLLHQLIREYAAAAYLLNTGQTQAKIPELAQDEFWRETCIAAFWLDKALHTADYLLSIMGDARIDLRVRVAAVTILGEVSDPRFVRRAYAGGSEAIEPQMVAIPAGLATLGGDDPESDDDEKPGCQVQVNAFELAVYPVTNATRSPQPLPNF